MEDEPNLYMGNVFSPNIHKKNLVVWGSRLDFSKSSSKLNKNSRFLCCHCFFFSHAASNQGWFQGLPLLGPPYGKLPILCRYHSHIFRNSYWSGMGIVWVRGPIVWKSHWSKGDTLSGFREGQFLDHGIVAMMIFPQMYRGEKQGPPPKKIAQWVSSEISRLRFLWWTKLFFPGPNHTVMGPQSVASRLISGYSLTATPRKPNMTMEKQPVEDVSPI